MTMRVKDAGFPFRPESVTDALLIHCGEKAAFFFLATERREDGYCYDCGTVIFRSSSVLQVRYGHPNDEAYPGHILYEAGLKDFDIAEVEESSWLSEVAAANARVFPNATAAFSGIRHHIFPFKESTLEILWHEFEYEISQKTYEELAVELSPWVIQY